MSDVNREVIKAYNLEFPDFVGIKGYTVAKRSIFILDMRGIVRYTWVTEEPSVEPDYAAVEKALEKIE